ncbi:hypothetical protein OG539_02180 [Actinacidiphila glaucinigra]|uniref:hypothetical protein n=1 Tax=Actinacidiphila glaucinigra TaxID=235986 RepID=UPI002DDC2EB1|nr:hypothetical protein [Actinacidiphila glaucinigra]WSD64766.1 hypothetical protein OIE69_40670 [Actinacidiphila glaucinigra]
MTLPASGSFTQAGGDIRETPAQPLWQPADMPWELREHAGRHFAVLFHYALPDDAWAVELSEAVPVTAPAAENPDVAVTHVPGAAFLVALVPDEDPNLEPTVRVYSPEERVVPYEIMGWFMEQVADQVDRCRIAFEQGGSEAAE